MSIKSTSSKIFLNKEITKTQRRCSVTYSLSPFIYIERRRNNKESDALSGAGAAGGGKELFNPAHALALFIIYTKRKREREQLRRIIHPNCHNTNEQKWEILLLIYSKRKY